MITLHKNSVDISFNQFHLKSKGLFYDVIKNEVIIFPKFFKPAGLIYENDYDTIQTELKRGWTPTSMNLLLSDSKTEILNNILKKNNSFLSVNLFDSFFKFESDPYGLWHKIEEHA